MMIVSPTLKLPLCSHVQAVAVHASSLPFVHKDFTNDEVQAYESRATCADAILLIASAVTDDE